jgi:hypothetical protein
MYSEPEDQAPWSNQSAPPGRPKGRRWAALAITAVVALVIGIVIGHSTASSGPGVIVAATVPPSPSTPVPVPTTPAESTPALPTATPSDTTDTTDATASSTPSPGASGPAVPVYLSQTTPVDNGGALNSPLDETISGVDYPDSIQQEASGGNGSTTVWDVAPYKTFTAEVGIDDSTSADGDTARIVFLNQSSVQLATVHVTVGSPVQVSVPLNGAVHFEIECVTEQADTYYPVTFGNAQFVP